MWKIFEIEMLEDYQWLKKWIKVDCFLEKENWYYFDCAWNNDTEVWIIPKEKAKKTCISEKIKNSEIWKIVDLVKTHWEEKVSQWFEIMQELFKKDLQELEFIAKHTKSEAIKKVLKLVMEYKINKI